MLSATLLLAQIQTTDLDFQPQYLRTLVESLGKKFGEEWEAAIPGDAAYVITGPGWTAPMVRERLAELTRGKWIGEKGQYVLLPDPITQAEWDRKDWAEAQTRKMSFCVSGNTIPFRQVDCSKGKTEVIWRKHSITRISSKGRNG
ncbi:MAG: hypothetical protein R2688_01485 [Fimbriimonadaceae bacterium]